MILLPTQSSRHFVIPSFPFVFSLSLLRVSLLYNIHLMLSYLQEIYLQVVRFLSPVECVVCHKPWEYICPAHRKYLVKHVSECYLCHTATLSFSVCDEHIWGVLQWVVVGFYYTRLVAYCVHIAKYASSWSMFHIFGQQGALDIRMHPDLQRALRQWKLIITSVPMHPRKQHYKRWYNQAEKLAEYLAEELCLKHTPLCLKEKNTMTQTRLSRRFRKQNAKDLYVYSGPLLPEGSVVLIVDDIITTWSTVQAVAEAIKKTNPQVLIWGWCVARNG